MASSKKIPRRKKIIPTFLAELSSCKLWRQTFISSYRPFPKQWKNSQLNLKSTRNEFFSWSFQQRFIFLLQSWRKEKNRAMDATNPFPQKRSLAVKIIGNKSENCSCFRSRKIASEEYFVRKPSGACLIFSAFFSFPKKKGFYFCKGNRGGQLTATKRAWFMASPPFPFCEGRFHRRWWWHIRSPEKSLPKIDLAVGFSPKIFCGICRGGEGGEGKALILSARPSADSFAA